MNEQENYWRIPTPKDSPGCFQDFRGEPSIKRSLEKEFMATLHLNCKESGQSGDSFAEELQQGPCSQRLESAGRIH